MAKTLGRDIEADDEQLRFGNGYDHNFSITGSGYREAAEIYCEESGIRMTVLTDLPGLQLYTANGMKDEPGKGGAIYGRRCAAAFETQYFPDAINKFNFEGGLLRAGEEFRSRTTYAFSAV